MNPATVLLFLASVAILMAVVLATTRPVSVPGSSSSAPPVDEECPTDLHRMRDGSFVTDSGQKFADMNAFQQWWHKTGRVHRCALPRMTGAGGDAAGAGAGFPAEELSARTPINKVDDYEFSRIFGYEQGGHMEIPRQNFNLILEKRSFDWADRPLSSDERSDKYKGLTEGFTADGTLGSVDAAKAQFVAGSDVDELVRRAYADDPDWRPVVTRVGANQWEVNELVPRRPLATPTVQPVDDSVVNTDSDAVDVRFRFRQQRDINTALTPPPHHPLRGRMETPYGPTTDHGDWTVPVPGWGHVPGAEEHANSGWTTKGKKMTGV